MNHRPWPWANGLLAALTACSADTEAELAGSQPNDGDSIYLNVMPPGSNGNSAGAIGLPGTDLQLVYPQNFSDALALYGDLAYAPPGLKPEPCNPPRTADEHRQASDLACNYFKHAGLEPDTVVSEDILTAQNGRTVRIRRDSWGVPFVEGEDRGAALFGMGFAGARDRLWLYDALRHLGRGRFSEFLGPASDTYGFDTDYAVLAGYDDAELTAMIDATIAKFGELGALVGDDLDQLVAGINAYLAYLQTPAGLGQAPPEYASLALSTGGLLRFPPAPFTREDVVASAVLIQSIFATGGGSEHTSALLLEKLDPSFGPSAIQVPEMACQFWRDVRHALDVETPYSIEEQFATQSPPVVDETCPQILPPGVAIWDVGSYQPLVTFAPEASLVPLPTPSLTGLSQLRDLDVLLRNVLPKTGSRLMPPSAAEPATRARPEAGGPLGAASTRWFTSLDPVRGARTALGRAGMPMPDEWSNFIAITGDRTRSGHPIAVMGPQTGYFVPQLLWEVAVQSNAGDVLDFAGRGVVFAMLPYINIGRGLDFAFSATSGNSDQVDVRVSRLCNLDGSSASRDDGDGDGFPDADGYRVDVGDGQGMACRALYRRMDEWVAEPSVASVALGGPAGAETVRRYILRTHYGPVFATATVNGEAVALSRQRSTFLAELDTAIPFALATTRSIHGARDFQQLFSGVTGTFNWLYVDQSDVGYLHSGLFPVRAAGIHPELPSWGDGRYEWTVDQMRLDGKFFEDFGRARPFPSRARPEPLDASRGVFEWPGHLTLADHPQVINPAKGSIASWNNAPARGWWAADFNGSYGPTHRADLLEARLTAFRDSGRAHDIGSALEIVADAAFTDLRGQELLPLLLRSMQSGPLSDEQREAALLMQAWLEAGSASWIDGRLGLGAFRRDRDASGAYDQRIPVLLMDAWYPRLLEQLLPELTPLEDFVGQTRYDAPGAVGSAYQAGWFQHLQRVLAMASGESPAPYRRLRCADGSSEGCRQRVLAALDQALADLGGFDDRDNWTGSRLAPAGGEPVEEHDRVQHRSFSLLSVPPIHWTNRPTFQQVVEIRTQRLTR